MENNFRTDEQLRNVLQEFEVLPDDKSFDAILEKMRKKKKRRAFIFFFTTGLIALTAFSIPLFFYLPASSPSQVNQTKQAIVTTSTSVSDNMINSRSQNNEVALNEHTSTTLPTNSNQSLMSEHAHTNQTDIHKNDVTSGKAQSIATTGNNDQQTEHSKNMLTGQAKKQDGETETISTKTKGETILHTADPINDLSGEKSDYMALIQTAWPTDTLLPEITTGIKQAPLPILVPKTSQEKNISFFLGININPQLNRFSFSKNPGADPLYNNGGSNFSSPYLDAKQKQRNYNLQVPFGIKAGIRLNNTYEFLAGFGLQSFKEKEYLYTTGSATVTPPHTSLPLAYSSGGPVPVINVFRYYYYSLEASRIFHSQHFLQFKLGIGLSANQFRKADYVYAEAPYLYKQTSGREAVSSWLFTGKVKGGIILNGNKRFQVHVSPGIFYSPTSIFKKEYAIRQKPYGFDLECLFLFRLWKH